MDDPTESPEPKFQLSDIGKLEVFAAALAMLIRPYCVAGRAHVP